MKPDHFRDATPEEIEAGNTCWNCKHDRCDETPGDFHDGAFWCQLHEFARDPISTEMCADWIEE